MLTARRASWRHSQSTPGSNRWWRIDQDWFKPAQDTAGWSDISYGAWQQQPVGLLWFQKHGTHYHDYTWYRTPLDVPAFDPAKQKPVLHFGAVDEMARVWVDGKQVLDRVFNPKENPNAWQEPFKIDLIGV